MKFTQLEILSNGKEIVFYQDSGDDEFPENTVSITPEMVDSVCVELQKLKAQILSENQEKK